MRKLADCRRLAHSVHARKQDDERIGILLDFIVDALDKYFLQELFRFLRGFDFFTERAVAQFFYDLFRRLHADIAGEQRLFKRFVELVVERTRRKGEKQLL